MPILVSDRLLEVYQPPERFIKQTYELNEIGNIHHHLKSKQTIKISVEELLKLTEDEKFWAREEDAEIVKRLRTSNEYMNDHDFSDVTNGYDISEYIASVDKYLPKLYYIWWAIHHDADIFINVYDEYSTINNVERNDLLRDKILGIDAYRNDPMTQLPKDTFDIKLGKITYNKFHKKKYVENVIVPSLMDPVTILSVNLPYEIYSYQQLPINIYTYDVLNKKYLFGSKTKEEFMELVSDIAENGITEPIFLRIHGQTLSSRDEETSLVLLAAMLLKLPSIPVNLYFSSEHYAVNTLFEKTCKYISPSKLYNNPSFINKILGPEIIVHDTNITEEALNKLNNIYPLSHYPEMNHDKYVTVRKFDKELAEKDKSENTESKIHDKTLDAAENKIKDEINLQIEKLTELSARQERAANVQINNK